MGEVGQKLQTLRAPILKHSTPTATSGPALHLCSVIASASLGPSEHNFSSGKWGQLYGSPQKSRAAVCESGESPYNVSLPQELSHHSYHSLPLFPCRPPCGWMIIPEHSTYQELTIWSTYQTAGTTLSTLHALLPLLLISPHSKPRRQELQLSPFYRRS